MRYVVFALIMLVAIAEAGIADWSDYGKSTLADVSLEHRSCNSLASDFHVETGSWKYSVRVISVGSSREILPETRLYVERWARSLGHGPDIVDLFTHEVQVREGSTRYWLPIQGPLMPAYRDKISPGDTLDVQIMLAGSSGIRWIFLINGFQRVSSAILNGRGHS